MSCSIDSADIVRMIDGGAGEVMRYSVKEKENGRYGRKEDSKCGKTVKKECIDIRGMEFGRYSGKRRLKGIEVFEVWFLARVRGCEGARVRFLGITIASHPKHHGMSQRER